LTESLNCCHKVFASSTAFNSDFVDAGGQQLRDLLEWVWPVTPGRVRRTVALPSWCAPMGVALTMQAVT
jgi:hypothetical protein